MSAARAALATTHTDTHTHKAFVPKMKIPAETVMETDCEQTSNQNFLVLL